MDYLSVRLPGLELLYQAYEEMHWVYEGLPKSSDLFSHYEFLVEHQKRNFAIAFYGDEYFYDGSPGKRYASLPDACADNFESFSYEHFLFLLHENSLSHMFKKKAFHKPVIRVW